MEKERKCKGGRAKGRSGLEKTFQFYMPRDAFFFTPQAS